MRRAVFIFIILTVAAGSAFGQQRGAPAGGGRGAAPQPPPTAKGIAPFDITGYWVSVVTEDWRWRMFPNKGDFAAIPLNPEGRNVANAWDPAKDEAAGEQCKGYGVGGLMRVPGRFRFTWQDDQTLKVESDAGTQTRMLYFGIPQGQGGDWQGVSKAEWELAPFTGGFGFGRGTPPANRTGSLKITTTKMKPGYVRRNGAPYSANAVVEEYYDMVREANGDTYLVLTMTVTDPTYLTEPMFTTAHFKKQADGAGWNPTPCAAR
jgi:hypothetical protein